MDDASLEIRRDSARQKLVNAGYDFKQVIMLHQVDNTYQAIGADAEIVAQACALLISQTYLWGQPVSIAGFSYSRFQENFDKLQDEGHVIAIDCYNMPLTLFPVNSNKVIELR